MSSESTSAEQPLIEVCYGPECSDRGGRELSKGIEALGLITTIGDCRNQCPHAPMALVNNRMISHATPEKIETRVKDIIEHPEKYTY